MKPILFFILLFGFAGNTYGEEIIELSPPASKMQVTTYYCYREDAIGFRNEKGKYKKYIFSGDRKFIMKLDNDQKIITVSTRSDTKDKYKCSKIFPYQHEVISCEYTFDHISFNLINGRYVKTSSFGYVAGDHDDVWVEIGKCEKFTDKPLSNFMGQENDGTQTIEKKGRVLWLDCGNNRNNC